VTPWFPVSSVQKEEETRSTPTPSFPLSAERRRVVRKDPSEWSAGMIDSGLHGRLIGDATSNGTCSATNQRK